MIARVAEILVTLGISIYFLLSQKTLPSLRHTSVLHSANRLQHLLEVLQYFFRHEAIFRLLFVSVRHCKLDIFQKVSWLLPPGTEINPAIWIWSISRYKNCPFIFIVESPNTMNRIASGIVVRCRALCTPGMSKIPTY